MQSCFRQYSVWHDSAKGAGRGSGLQQGNVACILDDFRQGPAEPVFRCPAAPEVVGSRGVQRLSCRPGA
eukprot:11224788-Lingulodinium_polyedra.AAC.1